MKVTVAAKVKHDDRETTIKAGTEIDSNLPRTRVMAAVDKALGNMLQELRDRFGGQMDLVEEVKKEEKRRVEPEEGLGHEEETQTGTDEARTDTDETLTDTDESGGGAEGSEAPEHLSETTTAEPDPAGDTGEYEPVGSLEVSEDLTKVDAETAEDVTEALAGLADDDGTIDLGDM